MFIYTKRVYTITNVVSVTPTKTIKVVIIGAAIMSLFNTNYMKDTARCVKKEQYCVITRIHIII